MVAISRCPHGGGKKRFDKAGGGFLRVRVHYYLLSRITVSDLAQSLKLVHREQEMCGCPLGNFGFPWQQQHPVWLIPHQSSL